MRPRSGWILIASVLLGAVTCPVLAAGESARDFLQPRIDRTRFDRFYHRLDLERDQEIIAELVFTDYTTALTELELRTDADADAAGRRRVADAMAGRLRVPPEQLRELRVAVLQTYRAAWGEADDLLQVLLESCLGMLAEDQLPHSVAALRDLRRVLWLRPRRVTEMFPEYAGDGVDVAELAASAAGADGELEGLSTESIVDRYAREMDRLLLETAAADREGVMAQRIAAIRRDEAARRREEQQHLERWKRLYELNQRTASRVRELALSRRGEAAAARWQRRFATASFPWLYRPTRPQRLHEWMSRRDLGSEPRRRADALIAGYRPQHQRLAEEAIALMIEGRLQSGRIFHPMMDASALAEPPARQRYERLLKNSGERTALDQRTADELEALVPARDRREMRRAVR